MLNSFTVLPTHTIENHKRKYQKITHVLGYLTGIFNALKIMSMLLIKIILEFKKKNYIMRFLYDITFQSHSEVKSQRKTNKFSDFLKKKLFKFKNELKILYSLFYNDNYQDEYLNTINIRTVLKGIQDIQKLKMIVFNKKEFKLFNSIPRPILALSKEKNKDLGTKRLSNFFNLMRVTRHTKNFTQKDRENRIFSMTKESIPESIEGRLNFFQNKSKGYLN